MRKVTSRTTYVTMLFLIISASGCGSLQVPSVPTLRNRTLEISPDAPTLYYQYHVCAKTNIFGGCKELKVVRETYDLADPAVRAQLKAMGFMVKAMDPLPNAVVSQ